MCFNYCGLWCSGLELGLRCQVILEPQVIGLLKLQVLGYALQVAGLNLKGLGLLCLSFLTDSKLFHSDIISLP